MDRKRMDGLRWDGCVKIFCINAQIRLSAKFGKNYYSYAQIKVFFINKFCIRRCLNNMKLFVSTSATSCVFLESYVDLVKYFSYKNTHNESII